MGSKYECVIPSRMGRDVFMIIFFYPDLIPNGILANAISENFTTVLI